LFGWAPSVGNSLAFWTNMPFTNSPNCEPRIVVEMLGNSWTGRFVQNANELPTAAEHA
jgi:hypothetical protein